MSQSLTGQTKRLQCTFRDASGTAVNPATITLTIRRLSEGAISLVTTKAKADMTNPSTGVFYYDFTPGAAGRYYARFTSGDGVDVEDEFDVSAGAG